MLKHNTMRPEERRTDASVCRDWAICARAVFLLKMAAVSEAPSPESVTKSDQLFITSHQDTTEEVRKCEFFCVLCVTRCMCAVLRTIYLGVVGVCVCGVMCCVLLSCVLCTQLKFDQSFFISFSQAELHAIRAESVRYHQSELFVRSPLPCHCSRAEEYPEYREGCQRLLMCPVRLFLNKQVVVLCSPLVLVSSTYPLRGVLAVMPFYTVTTGCVSPPTNWATSISSHKQQNTLS